MFYCHTSVTMSDQNKTALLLIQKIKADISKLETFLILDDANLEVLSLKQETYDIPNQTNAFAHQSREYEEEGVKVIESVYDGYFIAGPDGRKYPVPLNYSSKTKLIGWDMLKLKIMSDGSLVYKLIWQAPRKHLKATISRDTDGKYIAITSDHQKYYINQAAITFYKAQVWDEVAIIVNEQWHDHAALEAILQ